MPSYATVNAPMKHKMPFGIWALGLGSLFMDTSSEIIHGLLPVFLVSVIGASVTSIGVLEGMAEAIMLGVKVISGPLSDWLGRRKPLVILGYVMGVLSKPLFAIAYTISVVYGARLLDRIGKGIRGAPRDALVADLTPPWVRGRAFGLRQSLDTVGAFLGPILAIVLMRLTNNNYRIVFWLATIPGLLCVTVLVFGVSEDRTEKKTEDRGRIRFQDIKEFHYPFWFVVGIGGLFQLARFSEAFLILRAQDFGLGFDLAPVVLIAMNIVYSLSAYPVGHLSDTLKREWFLVAGLLILCLSDLVLGFAKNLFTVFLGTMLWGLHMGLTQGTLAAIIADTCSPKFRGTAYGLFNFFSAGALLLGNTIAGILWDQLGPQVTFVTGGVFSLLSVFAFWVTRFFSKRVLL